MRQFLRVFLFAAIIAPLSVHSATFTAAFSGSWSTPGTWSVVGPDSDGIPDANDDVFISSNVTVTLTSTSSNICRDFTISAGTLSLNNRAIRFYGSVDKSGGSITGNGSWVFSANPGTISGTFTNNGNWYFTTGSAMTIAAGTIIQKNNGFTIYSGATVTNLGTVRFTGGGITYLSGSSVWINGANSSLQLSANFSGSSSGVLDASANPNTVIYNGASVTDIKYTLYHHLTIQNSGSTVPSWTGGTLTVNGNLRIVSATLNCASQDIILGGSWVNTANTNCQNRATVTFAGSGTQTVTRTATEQFNNIVLSGTGTVSLATAINCSGSITINSGTLDVGVANNAVTVRGNFTNSSAFNGRNGTVTLNGTSAQAIGGTSASTFFNLTTSNAAGVTVNSSIQLDNLLTVSAGNFGPSASGSIHLTATGPTTYARIGVVGGTISGTSWVLDSYIDGPATAYWQYLSTPINGNTINDWDSDNRFYMSGVGGNDGNACCPTFYSVRTYNTSTNTYSNVTSTATAITPGRGYMLWMGDNMNSLTAPLVYDNRGTPNFGNVTRSVTAGGSGSGYNLVGNPYACPVTYSSVQAASGNIGASFMILQENGSYVTNPNGGVIAPSQGFMCIASATGNMTFTEACKNTSSVPNIIRQSEQQNYVRINVTNDQNGLGGETAIQFSDEARNGYDINFDMPFLPSPYETASNLWTTDRDGKDNILNALDASADVLEIPLTVQAAIDGNQTISFRGINRVTAYSCAWMENTETGERINLREKDSYSFFAKAGSTSSFILHFDRTGNNCPLAQQNLTESLDAQTQVYVANDVLMAKFFFTESTDVEIVIYDAEGREVAAPKQYTVSSQSVALESPGAHGVYFVQVIQADRVTTKKIYY